MDANVKNSCFARHTNKLRKRQAGGGDQDVEQEDREHSEKAEDYSQLKRKSKSLKKWMKQKSTIYQAKN